MDLDKLLGLVNNQTFISGGCGYCICGSCKRGRSNCLGCVHEPKECNTGQMLDHCWAFAYRDIPERG